MRIGISDSQTYLATLKDVQPRGFAAADVLPLRIH